MLCAFNECLLNIKKKAEEKVFYVFSFSFLLLLIIRGNEAHQVARTMFSKLVYIDSIDHRYRIKKKEKILSLFEMNLQRISEVVYHQTRQR